MNNNPVEFHEETPEEVKTILLNELHSNNRIRLFFGDNKTGQVWYEEYDIMGYIGKSTGTKPCLLLINNKNSTGGGAILTHCIVKITKNGRTLYQHKNYRCGDFEIKESDVPGYIESVFIDGVLHANFKKTGQATKYVEFMQGKRNSK